jgi:putative transposase
MAKPRLRRLQLLFTDHPIYYLTACTADRRLLLANDQAHAAFMEFARRATDHRVWVGRYVLMPDHLHCFAAFAPDSLQLSDWMKALKRHIASRLGIRWQKGFFDHVLRSTESYAQKWHYVFENPVRAGLVNRPEEWLFQGEIHPLEMLYRPWRD